MSEIDKALYPCDFAASSDSPAIRDFASARLKLPAIPKTHTTTGGPVLNYLQTVKAQLEDQAAKRLIEAERKHLQWSERLTPIEERLRVLLASIPDSVAKQGLSLDALRRMLAGKWRGNCHPGDLGEGLRKLGWVRKRDWSGGSNGFRAKWFKEKK